MAFSEEGSVKKLQSITKENTDLFCEQHMNGIQFFMKLPSPILISVLCEMNAWEQRKHLSSTGIPPGLSTIFPSALTGSTCLICNWTWQFYKIFNEPGIFDFSSLHSHQLLSKHSETHCGDVENCETLTWDVKLPKFWGFFPHLFLNQARTNQVRATIFYIFYFTILQEFHNN